MNKGLLKMKASEGIVCPLEAPGVDFQILYNFINATDGKEETMKSNRYIHIAVLEVIPPLKS